MDNFERGDRALSALVGGRYENPIKANTPSPISDLIADALHLARRIESVQSEDDIELVLSGIIATAIEQYGADCIEQAWENDDTWPSDTLQDPVNVPRAREILHLNGVLETFHRDILQRVGLPYEDIG